MSIPPVKVEVAFSTDPDNLYPQWQDISPYVASMNIRRGRNYELDTIEASTCYLKLNNGDRRFDPSYTLSPYAPYVLPMRKIRVSSGQNFVQNPSFETDTSPWIVLGSAATLSSTTTEQKIGKAAGKISGITASALAGIFGPSLISKLSAGTLYTCSVWAKGEGAAIGKTFEVALNEGGGALGELTVASSTVILSSSWQRVAGTGVISQPDSTYAQVYALIINPTGGEVVYVDSVQINEGIDNQPYVDEQTFLFTGFVERWPMNWDVTAPRWGSVDLTAVDGMASLEQAVVAGTFASGLTGTRINQLLTAASWPDSVPAGGYWTLDTTALGTATVLSYGVPATALDAGQSTIQQVVVAAADTASALSQIQDAETAEAGTFYFDGTGKPTFKDRHTRYGATSLVTFTDGDVSGAGRDRDPVDKLPYQVLTPDFDVTKVINDVTVTATGGIAQNAVDDASVGRFFRRSRSLSLPLTTDVDALERANYELFLHSQPSLRFDTLMVRPQGHPNTWPYALGLELGDCVTVVRTPQTTPAVESQTITRQCFVEAVEHHVDPNVWETTFQLSPAEFELSAFILDEAALDAAANARLVY